VFGCVVWKKIRVKFKLECMSDNDCYME